MIDNQGMRLWEAYLRAEYWVGFPSDRLLLRVGDPAVGLGRLKPTMDASLMPHEPWAYISAWNPGSELRMEFMNRQKQEDLELYLRQSGYPVIPTLSRDPTGQWPDEEGVLAFGLRWENGLALGRRFQQNAILAGMGEEIVQLLRC